MADYPSPIDPDFITLGRAADLIVEADPSLNRRVLISFCSVEPKHTDIKWFPLIDF
jgi:hypothetical protein